MERTETKLPVRYSDAQRLHWHACLPEMRRGSLKGKTAEVHTINSDTREEYWRPLEEC